MRSGRQLGAWLLALALVASSAAAVPVAGQNQNKEKEKKTTGREPGSRPLDTREALSRVVRNFKDGFEALSPSTLRDWVNTDKFYDYPRFEEGVTVLLRSAGEMRIFTREVSVEVKDDRAVMIVDAEMVVGSRQDPSRTEKRRQQITFDFHRTRDGWLITEINPRSFFLP